MIDHETGRTSDISPSTLGAQPTAIGYLRTDLCSYRGFVTARLRLTAIAHGYRLRWLVELPAYPSADHLTTLRTTLDRTAADAVIIVSAAHLPGRQFRALRAMTPVIVDSTVLPKTAGPLARLRALLCSRLPPCRISEWARWRRYNAATAATKRSISS
ncbi:hypothetical protein HGA13_14995 [Nocardia speluncae]|uniref:Uncharacterized protein n=1 Tax=Nocardia speluncae TaxID=419477 RepID=A0A846XGN7_9NOCA|nr:hypothetical protein [Nocardia speluncae]NKY34369.1 hypothetical protein [Nocardia speluncae]